MLKSFLRIIAYCCLYIPVGGLSSQGNTAEHDAARKNPQFLIIEFVNANNVEAYAGLSRTIPAALVKPLSEIGTVEVMSRRSAGSGRNGKNPEGHGHADLISDKHAISLGEKEKSDIVISGIYYILADNLGERIELKAKAIDVRTGAQIAAREKSGLLAGGVPKFVQAFSTELAQDITEAIAKDSSPFWRDDMKRQIRQFPLRLHLAPYTSLSLKNYNYYSQYEFGGRAEVSKRIFYDWLQPMLSTGGATAETQAPVSSLFFYFAQGGLSYPVTWRKLVVSPFLLGGVHGGKVASGNTTINFLLPSVESGLKADLFFNNTVGLSLSASYVLLLDSALPVSILRLNLGIALRL